MRVLVDTNVLIRLFQRSNPSSPIAASAIQELKKHEFEIVIGKSAHDARLVSAMVKHSVPNILTFNVQDFRRYSQVKAFNPVDILAGLLPPVT
jgi:predicted nucleic acid-binding protein